MPTPHLTSLNPSQDTNLPTSSTSIPRPPVVRQPTSVERVGVGLGEEDDSEARRLKYVALVSCAVVLYFYALFLEVVLALLTHIFHL